MKAPGDAKTGRGKYAPINGLKMYYEIEGAGDPIVYIPPAFGFAGMKSFPSLARTRSIITVDLQGNGRTPDIPGRPLSIESYAEDVVGLLDHLGISKADFFGESYGASTAIAIALRHPALVGRVAALGATYGPPQMALDPKMMRMEKPPTPDSRGTRYQKERYEAVAPDPSYWPKIWNKLVGIRWEGCSKKELASIAAPVLIVVGDRDFVLVEHALETFRAMPNAELAVIPDAGHFMLYSEPGKVMPVVEHFLNKPTERVPVGTAALGYYPGETR